MKFHYTLIVLVLTLFTLSCSSDGSTESSDDLVLEENILENGLWLKTQANVDFYGRKNITEIKGILRINSQLSEPIVDLSPLHTIKKVEFLSVTNNHRLKNLDGLENLNFERLEIGVNAVMENINALRLGPNYTGSISLHDLPEFTGYDVFRGIEELEFVYLNRLPLENLDHFQDLRRINKRLVVSEMYNLENMSGLQLEYLGDDLGIQKNQLLNSLSGLESITQVGPYGKIEIYLNSSLNDYCALNQIITEPHFADLESWYVWGNAYNPVRQDLLDGNCN